VRAVDALVDGAIPACAGSSTPSPLEVATAGPSPLRGEQDPDDPDMPVVTGPSPHARGTVGSLVSAGHADGAIPVCAGSRSTCRCGRRSRRDHPRVRGEQIASPTPSSRSWEPSPHARGAGARSLLPGVRRETIPARTGSRAAPSTSRDHHRHHPVTAIRSPLPAPATPAPHGARGGRWATAIPPHASAAAPLPHGRREQAPSVPGQTTS